MLLALLTGFALSQAFRTVTSTLAHGLQTEFGLSNADLGAFAGLFGLSFGIAQLLMGIALDKFGLRRTIVCALPLAVAGALLSALAPSYPVLMLGQLLIGVGCSPAFLVCTLFVARHFPPERFAFFLRPVPGWRRAGPAVYRHAPGLGGANLELARGLCRAGCAVPAGLGADLPPGTRAALPHAPPPSQEGWGQALRGFFQLFALPHTWGMVVLGMSCYAAFLSLRGLWLGPLLMGRFDFSLVQAGNVALGVSLISLFAPGCLAALILAWPGAESGSAGPRWPWPGSLSYWPGHPGPAPAWR